jgi:hypothetical protein
MRLYQYFNLAWLMAYPWNYFGAILAENRHGQHLGFYPTPMCVVNMMARMTFGDPEKYKNQPDNRLRSVNEPCVGTGRMLLYASNYSLILRNRQDVAVCQQLQSDSVGSRHQSYRTHLRSQEEVASLLSISLTKQRLSLVVA